MSHSFLESKMDNLKTKIPQIRLPTLCPRMIVRSNSLPGQKKTNKLNKVESMKSG